MKRKFSLNLAPMVATRSENKAIRDALAARDITTPPSPHAYRRILPAKLETDLRAACEAILTHNANSYGLAAAAQAAEQKSDPQALHASRKAAEHRKAAQDSTVHAKHSAVRDQPRADLPVQLPPNAYTYKPKTALKHLFPPNDGSQAHGSSQDWRAAKQETRLLESMADSKKAKASDRGTSHGAAHERPGTGPRDPESPGTNYSTPLSASTDALRQHGSTAMTSAEPLSITSKRNSHHMSCDDDAVAIAEAAAVPCTKEEKRRHREHPHTPGQQQHKEPRRSRSASRSMRSEIKDYFRPGSSTGISRTDSKESMWSRSSEALSVQPPATHGWRSWGFQKRPSQETLSSPSNSSLGRHEKSRDAAKEEINLNRQLPPLPGLDQWKGPEFEDHAKNASTTHIANLMQVVKVQSRKQSTEKAVELISPTAPWQRSHSGKRNLSWNSDVSMHFHPRSKESEARDLDSVVSAMRYGNPPKRDNKSSASLVDSGHGQDDAEPSRKASVKLSLEHSGGEAPNFSRNIGLEKRKPLQAPIEMQFKNKVEIKTKSPAENSSQSKRGLKKAISHLILRTKRERKNDNWMDEIEKNGIKGGILIQDKVAGAPVVRY